MLPSRILAGRRRRENAPVAVLGGDLQRWIGSRREGEAQVRVLRDRDTALHLEDELAAPLHFKILHVLGWGVLAGYLIHLHAGEVGMADHHLRLAHGRRTVSAF